MTWNPHAKFQCDQCGAKFRIGEAKMIAWGDAACPSCGSVRIERVLTRFQIVFHFLLTYEQY
jgi:predicted nucleic acid-binding Zn ribbon protein